MVTGRLTLAIIRTEARGPASRPIAEKAGAPIAETIEAASQPSRARLDRDSEAIAEPSQAARGAEAAPWKVLAGNQRTASAETAERQKAATPTRAAVVDRSSRWI